MPQGPIGNMAANYFQHPNGTRFIITVGGDIGSESTSWPHVRFTNQVAIYNVDQDSWYMNSDSDFNYPHSGAFYDNNNGVMYENVFYVGCPISSGYSFNKDIYAFMMNGPDDFTWTKVGEISIADKHSAFSCSSMEVLSDTLYYH